VQRDFFVPLGSRGASQAAFPPRAGNSESALFSSRSFFVLISIIAFWTAVSFSAPAAPQALKGHVPRVTRQLAATRRAESDARLDLAIGLPLRNREELTNLLAELYQPGSANFRHYLTPEQFAARFSPSQEDYEKVKHFAQSHGLKVKGGHPNRTMLDVSGSVGDIERAFHIRLHMYQHPVEARSFFAPDVEPTLDVDTPVLAISGLDNYVRPKPKLHPAAASTRPLVQPQGGGGSGGGGGGGGGSGVDGSYFGYDFTLAYAPDIFLDGAGQSVGLFQLFGYNPQDIQDFQDNMGVYPYVNVQPILIDGATSDDSRANNLDSLGYLQYAMEVAADIEMAISMAPGLSNVLVYIGPTPLDVPPLGTNYIQGATTTAQINDVLNRMATDNLAKQLSCSYGFDINLSTVQIFQQFAAQGQSFFLASGDSGAFASTVVQPADVPYVTVVGGTTLTVDSSGGWLSETAWLTPASYDPLAGYIPEMASGGGVSRTYAIPPWQQGISMAANQGSATMRNVPDVAMVSDNIDVVYGNTLGLAPDWLDWPTPGTSLAAPLWAGFMALVNQQAAANGQPPVGFANPALYAIAKSSNYHACFHDITTGSNTNSSSPTKYNAVAGYDLCTGLGTPAGNSLLQALLAPPFDTLSVNPPLGFTSFGRGGGPFSLNSQSFTLKNTGSGPINWSLVNTSTWLTASSTSGTLGPGASTTVSISLNSAATSFLIGSYSGNVVIVNQTAGTTQNRQFDLYVGNGGFETGDLTDWTLIGSPELVFALAGDDETVAGRAALDGRSDELFVQSGLYGGYLGECDWNGNPAVGSLSQAVATAPRQQYLISFWLTCVADSQGATTANLFAAKWNGLTLYAKTNMAAFGWTNLQFAAPAATTSSTLEFDFRHDPGAFGLDGVRVEPVPPPVIQALSFSGGNVNLTWSSYPNLVYKVQSASALGRSWTDVTTVTATGILTSSSTASGSPPQSFYRVLLLPAP
jgi:hypothetical protein